MTTRLRPYRIVSFTLVAVLGLAIHGWFGCAVGAVVWHGFQLFTRAHLWPPDTRASGTAHARLLDHFRRNS